MLTARSIVITTIVIAVLSIVGGCLTMLRTPDHGGLGRDSYGTRAYGHRALFEILKELDVPVRRRLAPPTAKIDKHTTLVFWASDAYFVQLEPAYLKPIADWVRAGGRVVVAPAKTDVNMLMVARMQQTPSRRKPTSLLKELQLPDLKFRRIDHEGKVIGGGVIGEEEELIDLKEGTPFQDDEDAEQQRQRTAGRKRTSRKDIRNFEEFREEFTAALGKLSPTETRSVAVRADGELAELGKHVESLAVPDDSVQVVDLGDTKPLGTLTFADEQGGEHTLVATFRVGKGSVVVVAEPTLAANRCIAKNDNSIMAVDLLAGGRGVVVLDGFYHGLTIRGNPLWLFTRRNYGVMTAALLTLIGIWIWRHATFLGPPLAPAVTSRRSVGEYVEAMARFLQHGRDSRRYLLQEVRDGVLWFLRHDLGLSPGHEHPDDIIAVIARRDPKRAEQVAESIRLVDELLANPDKSSERETVRSLQRISACL